MRGGLILMLMFCGGFGGSMLFAPAVHGEAPERRTRVSIKRDAFHINGRPTYEGRTWTSPRGQGHRIEGLLLNARMVQGVFDDLNAETRDRWAYPDAGEWDPERNTREFVEAMPDWREHGMLAFTINLQGGCPTGYCAEQPWENSAFAPDGSLREGYMDRLGRILDRADELGMVVILGYFYFGQDERLEDEAAVKRAVDHATEWVLDRGYTNVIVEVNNECDIRYDHEILTADRVHELIERVRDTERDGRRLLAGTSYAGGRIPGMNVVEASDFILLHGNGVREPDRIVEMVRASREMAAEAHGEPIPILFNEDDNYRFDEDWNNFIAAVSEHASWGYFDWRRPDEEDQLEEGYQSVPVNWRISSERKRAFFELVAEVTGAAQDGDAGGE